MKGHSTTVAVSSGHVHKHIVSHARRVLSVMHGDRTPAHTRRKLRRALARLAACTDLSKRRSLDRVENVAAVLACTGPQRILLGAEYRRAFRARVALCRVMEAHARETDTRLIKLLAGVAGQRPRARRAVRTRRIAPRPATAAVRLAA